jgi:hypothetical protein
VTRSKSVKQNSDWTKKHANSNSVGAVGLVWPSFARSQSPSSSTDCQQDVIRIVRLEKSDGGWDFNFIDKAKVIKQGLTKATGRTNIPELENINTGENGG